MERRPGRAIAGRDLVLLGLAAACWGLGTVVSKLAIGEMSPFVLFPIQLAAATVALALLMRWTGQPLGGSPRRLARLGILNPGLAYALGLTGLTTITASLYVLLWALEPLLILVLAALFLGEGVSRRFVLLSALGAAGMAVVVYQPAAGGQLAGVLLVVAGVGCCAAYTVIARGWVAESDSTAQVVLAQQAWALGFAVVLAAVAGIAGADLRMTGVSPSSLLVAVVSGLLYYAAAYWFYLSALRNVPAAPAATSFYLIPVFGLAASFALLGERLEPAAWLGVVIVVVAIVAIIRQPAHRPARTGTALAR